MSERIYISPGQLSDSLALRNDSALARCTEVDGDDRGVFFALLRPGLSSGEKVLWRLLAWLNGANDLPSETECRAHLDSPNLAAAQVAIAAGLGVSS